MNLSPNTGAGLPVELQMLLERVTYTCLDSMLKASTMSWIMLIGL